MRSHPFPFRTRKLSSFTLTILGWRRPGKLNQCRHLYSSLAQSVEHSAVNRVVARSSRAGGAKREKFINKFLSYFILFGFLINILNNYIYNNRKSKKADHGCFVQKPHRIGFFAYIIKLREVDSTGMEEKTHSPSESRI